MREEARRRVIVFGGTFDPVHEGHLAVAEQAVEAARADELWFVPTGTPHLHEPPVASGEDRLALVRAAVEGRRGFAVRDDEIRREVTAYTVDTMRAMHADAPHTEFTLLLGADAARSIPRWHRARDLLRRERFLVVNRSGCDEIGREELGRLGFDLAATTLLHIHSPDVSASQVRRRAARGQSLAGLVPQQVAALIADRGLYAAPSLRA